MKNKEVTAYVNSKQKVQKRIKIGFFIFMIILIALVVRIGYLQFGRGKELSDAALEQQTRDRQISARRGTIYDRNGKQLAVSADVETVGISPITVRESGKADEYAKELAKILDLKEEEIKEKINSNLSYVTIKKKVEKERTDKIRDKKMEGVYLDEDTKRYYPYNNIASHIIGFAGDDNQGLLGIEMVYDKKLKGQNGRVVTATNVNGTEMPYKYERFYSAQDGYDITLTIDVTIQHFLEKHLDQAIVDYDIRNGAAGIVMDVRTGEILAMATKPDFNLNEPFAIIDSSVEKKIKEANEEEKSKLRSDYLNKLWRNKAVVDSYEPGSTFKIITSAMALEEGVVTINDAFDCVGHTNVGDRVIHCWKLEGHGHESFVEALMNSCNPAFIQIGAKIGRKNFYKYYKGFGFTERTGIELNGETIGTFYPEGSFNEVELATASFGQGPTVTPLQMLAAIGAVANDGNLLKPHIIKNISDINGNIVEAKEPEVVRQVVSSDTSRIIKGILEEVVSEGTGGQAYLEGFRIGGKTGTSEKLPRGNGKYVASFAGIAPSDDPQVVLILLLDEPGGELHSGGSTAAPLAGKILDDILRYMGIQPAVTQMGDGEVSVPDIVGKSVEEATEIINKNGLRCITKGEGKIVNIQVPKANTAIAEGGTVMIYTGNEKPTNSVKMPDIRGKSYSYVKEIFEKNNLILNAVGSSEDNENLTAISQGVAPGEYVTYGTQITVEFEDKHREDAPVSEE